MMPAMMNDDDTMMQDSRRTQMKALIKKLWGMLTAEEKAEMGLPETGEDGGLETLPTSDVAATPEAPQVEMQIEMPAMEDEKKEEEIDYSDMHRMMGSRKRR